MYDVQRAAFEGWFSMDVIGKVCINYNTNVRYWIYSKALQLRHSLGLIMPTPD